MKKIKFAFLFGTFLFLAPIFASFSPLKESSGLKKDFKKEKKYKKTSSLGPISKITGYFSQKIKAKESHNFQRENKEVDLREIVFGQSLPMVGEKSLYSEQIISGINAKFFDINSKGGIKGKFLKLVSLNDFADPEVSYKNVKNLYKKNKIDLFFGSFGTQSVLNSLPMIKDDKILMLFPFSSDHRLKDGYLKSIVNGARAAELQIDKILNHAVHKAKFNKIAIFYPEDDFGSSYAEYAADWLREMRITPTAICGYNPKNVKIFKIADEIIESDPEAVICLSTYMPTSRLISRFLRKGHYEKKFYGLDLSCFCKNTLNNSGANFSYVSFIPDPETSDLEIVKKYALDMKKYFPNEILSIIGLEYYINATIIEKALRKIEEEFSRENIKSLLQESIELIKNEDLGGFVADFNFQTRQAYPLQPYLFNGKKGFIKNVFDEKCNFNE